MAKTHYLDNKSLEKWICVYKQSMQDKVKYKLIIEDLEDSDTSKKRLELLKDKKKEYNKALNDYDISQQELAKSFLLLAENILRYRKFHFVEVDDAIQEFTLICFDKIDRFDPSKGKAFSYMTTCILNHYRQLYRAARNYNELKRKYGDHLQVNNDSFNVKTKGSFIKDKFTRL